MYGVALLMGYRTKTFTVTLATAGVAERVVLPANDIRSRSILIQNDHDNTGYVCFGGSEVTAVTKGIRLQPGASGKYSLIEHMDNEAELRASEVYLVGSANNTLVRIGHDYEDQF
jgi:hypothetical protein